MPIVRTLTIPKDRTPFSSYEARCYMCDNRPYTRTQSQSAGPDDVIFPAGISDVGEISWCEPSSNPGQGFRLSFLIWRDKNGGFQRIQVGDSRNEDDKRKTWYCESAELSQEEGMLFNFGDGNQILVKEA